MYKKYRIGDFFWALLCFAVIFSLAVTLVVMFRPLYYWEMELLDIPGSSGFSAEVCRANYDAVIDYLLPGGPAVLQLPSLPMSEHGAIHFADVKNLLVVMQIFAFVGVPVLLAKLFWQLRRKTGSLGWLRLTAWLALGLVVLVGGAVAINWDWTFVTLHHIFFRNDYWIFYYDLDPIILTLPDTFFMHAGLLVLALIAVLLAGCEAAFRLGSAARRKGLAA